jgi:hypothetical protein
METKNTKIEEIDPTTGIGIDYSGFIQDAGVDYEMVNNGQQRKEFKIISNLIMRKMYKGKEYY